VKNKFRGKVFFSALIVFLSASAAWCDQRLDGVWVGTEKLTLSTRTDCPKPASQSMTAKIAIAQNGTLLGLLDGYAPGRYTNLRWAGNTLIFELPNKRKGELRLSADGKTLIEKGYVRRTISIGGYFNGPGGVSVGGGARQGALSGQAPPQITGFTACLDEVTGTFRREK
jgi:hypothetical protein